MLCIFTSSLLDLHTCRAKKIKKFSFNIEMAQISLAKFANNHFESCQYVRGVAISIENTLNNGFIDRLDYVHLEENLAFFHSLCII